MVNDKSLIVLTDGANPVPKMNGHAPEPALRALTDSTLLARYQWMRQAGIGYNGERDYYQVLGYDRIVTTRQYRDEYARGGIAKRIVEAFPKATWRGGVEVYEDDDPTKETAFEKDWNDLNKRLKVWTILQRVDILAGLSTFAVLLIGAPGEDLSQELPKGKVQDIKYLQPYLGGGTNANTRAQTTAVDADATVFEYETDPKSERFGEPKSYTLKRTDFVSPALQRPVHWSRIIHIAEGCLDDNVFGQPVLENVWNLLQDLQKVTGGGAEAFWLRANQGLHLNIDKDMALPAVQDTIAALKEQADAYKHQMTRWLRTRGVDVEVLGSDVANFGPSAEAILKQIAGSKGIPMRILTGSEEGSLASEQDEGNFESQVQDRRTAYAGPLVVRRLVDRLLAYGYLTPPKKDYQIGWATRALTETEKADGALKWAQVNQVAGEPIYTGAEIREHWTDFKPLTFEEQKKIAEEKAAIAAAAQPAPPPAPEAPPGAPVAEPTEEEPEETEEKEGPEAPPAARAAMAGPHKFSSTQIQLPPHIAGKLFALGASIPKDDLAELGCEDDAHITVKYGLHTNESSEVLYALTNAGPVRFSLGPLALFNTPDYDVLYASVDSPDLHNLNRKISSALEVTDTHPTYTPHATVAYLKPGRGAVYVGGRQLAGLRGEARNVLFSPAQGQKQFIPLEPRAAEVSDEEIVKVLAAAIESGATEVIQAICGVRPRAAIFSPEQARDERGRWIDEGGFISSPSDALISLGKKEIATIAREDVFKLVEKAGDSAGPIDITNLSVEGSPLFVGGLNRSRDTMPQIPKEHMAPFLAELEKEGVKVTHESVNPTELLPTQNEIDATRIGQKIKDYNKKEDKRMREIVISKDDFVLDGHHRWGVQTVLAFEKPKAGIKVPAVRIGMNVEDALERMLTYTRENKIANRALEDGD